MANIHGCGSGFPHSSRYEEDPTQKLGPNGWTSLQGSLANEE
jgi:hypothetical protein